MHKPLLHCVCCESSTLIKVLDFGDQPLANAYLQSKTDAEVYYPLAINFCPECTHIQLTCAVHPDLLFKNYLYVSGTTSTLRKYFRQFAAMATQRTSGKNVLDIACNDGSQLDAFKALGYNTFGIDPAENLYSLSAKRHTVVCDYFTERAVQAFKPCPQFDLIVAQNVFAHTADPKAFLELCAKIVAPMGEIYIQTSQAHMVEENQFDTIYHEHISFFSVHSMQRLAQRVGLILTKVFTTPIHGTSFVFVFSPYGTKAPLLEKPRTLKQLTAYAARCQIIAAQTAALIKTLQKNGHRVIGYGAAAKGNAFINFSGFSLEYIVDDNPLKHGLYTPKSHILIRSPDVLAEEPNPIFILPLAWNFFDEIKAKVATRITNVAYIRYFPTVELYYA